MKWDLHSEISLTSPAEIIWFISRLLAQRVISVWSAIKGFQWNLRWELFAFLKENPWKAIEKKNKNQLAKVG